jgi:hypothetical protein
VGNAVEQSGSIVQPMNTGTNDPSPRSARFHRLLKKLLPFAVDSSTISVPGSFGTAASSDAALPGSGQCATSEQCSSCSVFPRPAETSLAVSIRSVEFRPSSPRDRLILDGSPQCIILRPDSEL